MITNREGDGSGTEEYRRMGQGLKSLLFLQLFLNSGYSGVNSDSIKERERTGYKEKKTIACSFFC